jgi:uncharacterized protein YacL
MFIYVYKLIFVLIFAIIGYSFPPFQGTPRIIGALIGSCCALALSILAIRIKKTELKYLWSAIIGILGGIILGLATYLIFEHIFRAWSAYIFLKSLVLIGFPITGLFVGIHKPNLFSPMNIKEFFRGSSAFTESFIVDTSAIIDGRIVAIIDSGFVEGEIIITQFVLAELQLIADSNDPNKKIRGKRGLDVVEQLRKNPGTSLTILNKNIPSIREVDQKLVLLAKENNFKIITNDVNLSRIAKLQDVKVLNVNELAFSLKPIVHPGEHLKVYISREGKEKKQGISYLDDGTMIVIDDAKYDIGKDVMIEVTSVLQTTTGKMIFGKKL